MDARTILDEFTIEPVMNHATLARYVKAYPQYVHELLEAFHQFQMIEVDAYNQGYNKAIDDAIDTLKPSARQSGGISFASILSKLRPMRKR